MDALGYKTRRSGIQVRMGAGSRFGVYSRFQNHALRPSFSKGLSRFPYVSSGSSMEMIDALLQEHLQEW